jgi:tRNA A64-2'-O-ribosylphosphate transferase
MSILSRHINEACYAFTHPGTPFSMSHPAASDLIFSEQANHNFSKTLGDLKRSTLSIHNRLRSIEEDAAFARKVREAYNRPLIANERCGSWYIPPDEKSGSAYFKSTDGHTGVWKFSSRRLNLHLLDVIGKNDGFVRKS